MEPIGIVLHHGVTDGAQLARCGRLAEACGYESLWVTERLFHEETFALLGYLAAATERLRLGVGVVNPFTRSPALTAMGAATIDRLTGGRMLLGLGRSERDVIEGRIGLPYRHPRRTLEESVHAIRRLLAGERVAATVGDATLDARLALRPVHAGLPIYVAAIGRRALRLAGRVADGVLLNAYVPVGYVPWAIAAIREGAHEAGRDAAAIEIACMLVVREGPDPAALRAPLRERVARLLCEEHTGEILLETAGHDPGLAAAVRFAMAAGRSAEAERSVDDALIDALYLLGPAARLRERIDAYREAGVTLPLVLPRLDDFERIARALAPAGGEAAR
jgi:5,10-methylenetetrahydromethanopterin reductase